LRVRLSECHSQLTPVFLRFFSSAQQLLNQRLHVPARLALGDEFADVAPDGGEVPPTIEFEFPDGCLQFGSPGRER
jgi:hypothetical protein